MCVCAENMAGAGISVWILTGDKKETAINISYSCGHFVPSLSILDITGLNRFSVLLFINTFPLDYGPQYSPKKVT